MPAILFNPPDNSYIPGPQWDVYGADEFPNTTTLVDNHTDPTLADHIHKANITLLERLNAQYTLDRTEQYKLIYSYEELTPNVKRDLMLRNIHYLEINVLNNRGLCSLVTDIQFLNRCCVGLYRSQWAQMYSERMTGFWNTAYCDMANYSFHVEINFYLCRYPLISPYKYTENKIAKVYTNRTVRLCESCFAACSIYEELRSRLEDRVKLKNNSLGKYVLSTEERQRIYEKVCTKYIKRVIGYSTFSDTRRLRSMVYDHNYNQHSKYILRRTFFCDRCHVCLLSSLNFRKNDPYGEDDYVVRKMYTDTQFVDPFENDYDHSNNIFDNDNDNPFYGMFIIVNDNQ